MAYNKKVWGSDEVITKEALNNIENGIESVEKAIPTKTSQLVNDSNFITQQQDMSNYVTQDQMHEHNNLDALKQINLVRMQAWDNAVNGGNVNLDDYVTKETFEEFEHVSLEQYNALLERVKQLEKTLAESSPSEPEEEPTDIPCTNITLDKTSLTFENYNTQTIRATVTPSNTTDTISWKSNANSIATVLNGVVSPVSNGNCTITATCGSYSASCSILVSIEEDANVPCESVTISPDTYTITNITETYKPQVTLTPSNTTDEVTWMSEDKTIAIVSDNGVITPISNGTCTIYAYCGFKSDSISITVNADNVSDTLYDIHIDKDLNITSNSYYRIEATTLPLGISGSFYWSSSDPSIVGLSSSNSNGDQTLLPGKNGTAELTVTFNGTDPANYLRKKYTVTVNLEDNTENTEILYNNPTIVIEGVKAKATQGDIVQYFDVSCEENNGHLSYNSSRQLTDSEGNTYYLALTNKGTSPFGINGLHLDSGGWITEASSTSGEMYNMQQSVLQWNDFNMNLTIQNLNDSMPTELLEKSLSMYNQTLPSLNMTIDPTSKNTIELGSWDDGSVGYCGKYADSLNFFIHIDETVATEQYGPYTADNNQWLSTVVHELGHTLGPADNAAHLPSMYNYGRNKNKCVYLQPNDIAWIEYLHKEQYGVDITTTQEQVDSQVLSLNLPSATSLTALDEHNFEYIYYDDVMEGSDVVIECQLKYNKTEFIDISNSFKLEYNVYDIINEVELKGDLINKQLKIHISHDLDIDENYKYKLYLKQYKSVPCSLINPYQGIEKL